MPTINVTTDRINIVQRIWYSIFPGTRQRPDDRQRYRRLFNSLVLHFRPRAIPERTLKFTLTWGLGGMAVVLVAVLFATGLMMKLVYQPVPDRAYASIIYLQNTVLFGQLIRNLHHWSGNALLLIVFLHWLRVFFTGAFQAPRQFNWIIGMLMFLLILGSNFSGYLLPWDQLAYWAITICTGMLEYIPVIGGGLQKVVRGGVDIGPATLSNFYAIHTAVIPACLLILMPFHFWRVRKSGGLVIPRTPQEDPDDRGETVAAIPNLIMREVVVALVLVAVLMALSISFNAPLEAIANPGLSPNPTKAPWYFAGIQELLLHFHPLFAVMVIPGIILAALLFLPYWRYDGDTAGVWFCSDRGRKMARVAVAVSLIVTALVILADEYIIDFAAWTPSIPPVISNGMIPAALALACTIGFYRLMKKRYTATNNETIQAVFVLLLVAFIILTITCVWFRGNGMALAWPWAV
ncbi:MAG: cytochrome b N-terminal domain-containing protein [Desulfobacteraceae bacterium]|jgi:quinol-cytochrome oxidoreductase complex cytochrome b subunit|nr:cytochrome b N-terminal domain-containing protein [Desulfobacteraceae bacterium]